MKRALKPIYIALALVLGCASEKKDQAHDAGVEIGSGLPHYADVDQGVFPQDRVLDIQVSMSDAAWTQLLATATQEVWSTADVTIDGQHVGAVGFRPKGEYSLDTCIDKTGKLVCEKLSFKFKFHAVDPELRFYGLKRLVLNKLVEGGGVFFESLGYRVFRDFGIVAPRTSYATLTINGKPQGLYTVVEPIDGRFTKDHFESGDGNLYKEAWPNKTSEAAYASALEDNQETASNAAFVAFATDMLAATDEALPATLGKYMDLDRTLAYMAVDYGIANWDGITTFYAGDWGCQNHNYYMYQDENQARFTLIPWDLNAVFFLEHWLGDIQPWDTLNVDCKRLIPVASNSSLYTRPAACDPMMRALALSKDRYRVVVRRLLDKVFVVDRLRGQIDAYLAQVTPALKTDPFLSLSEVSGSATWIKGNLTVLRRRLEAVLAQGTAIDAGVDAITDSGAIDVGAAVDTLAEDGATDL